MRPEPRYKKGDRIGGRYLVHQVLMGGMGEVYLCLDLKEMQPYALKTFQQRYLSDAQRLRRAFEREVATWVALEKHPNIVHCFWMQVLDNQPFMCLEWIASEEGKGTDLGGWLQRGPLELKLALEVAIDICNGLIYAQQKQPRLVHRDLKPGNILMAQAGLAKITDFGLAQIVQAAGLEVAQESAADSHQSFVGAKGIAGTPAYMAPEQWRGEQLDERTDIYALGCILHELLTGVLPFTVDFTPTTPQHWQRWLAAMQTAHECTPYPKLPALFVRPLEEVLAGCLAKAPVDRPASLHDLRTRLVELYQQHFDQPFPARPDPGIFTAADYNNRSLTYQALGQHEKALDDIERALALNPNNAETCYNRGNIYYALGQHVLALNDIERALALNPNFAQAYSNRALIYQALGQQAQALEDYNRAVALDPNLAQAYSNRGNIYQTLGQQAQALDDYNRALVLSPVAQTYSNRGLTHQALGQPAQALADFERALTLDPDLAQAYSNRGLTHQALGQPAQALADFERALALNPNDAQIYYNRGTTYAILGQYAQALADFERALALNPNDAQAYHNRGLTHQALGQLVQALDDFERALGLNPNDVKAYLNIGALLGNQGRLEEALPYFEQAAKLGEQTGAQYAAHARQMLGMETDPQVNPAQQAFDAFQQATSPEAMRQAVVGFPMLVQAEFVAMIEQVIAQQVPSAQRPALQQRLDWLRQVATRQKPGFFSRLFNRGDG